MQIFRSPSVVTVGLFFGLSLGIYGCPEDDDVDPPDGAPTNDAGRDSNAPDASPDATTDAAVLPSTHTGTISIQDRVVLGAPQLGHGSSLVVDFSAAPRKPDYDEEPGQITGCKAWSYDVDADPPPGPAGDVGTLVVTGTGAPFGPGCVFQGAGGYVCPTSSGTSAVAIVHGTSGGDPADPPGTARITVDGAAFEAADRGRYLDLAGNAFVAGRHPIVAVLGPHEVRVAKAPGTNGSATSASFQVLAAAGPVPGTPADESPGDPIRNSDSFTVRLDPKQGSPFSFPSATVTDVGDAFTADDATRALLVAIPTTGAAFRIACDGAGGTCAPATYSILQLQTTDADPTGLSPYALPAPKKKQVVLTCVKPGDSGGVTVPAEASRVLADAHAKSPITRIRTAFMRNGVALTQNASPPLNTVRIVAGHQVIGFTQR